jgi:flagellar motor switch protein FliM
VEVSFSVHHVEAVKAAELPRLLSRPAFFAALSPAPHAARALLELELGLAHATVDAMLGGGGDAVQARSLTDIEEGVLGYLVLELLKTLSEGLEPSLPRMRLESTPRTPQEAAEALGLEDHLLLVQLRVLLGAQGGYVRVFLPASVLGVSRPPERDAAWRARRRAEWERNAGRLVNASAWLRAEVGYAEIASSDLGALQVRDVVLLDRVSVRPHKGETGPGVLRLGRGRVGRMDAELLLEDGQYKAKITGFSLGEEPPPGTEPAGGGADGPGENTSVEKNGEADGADLVADIPLQIAVELSRVSVSADQVVSLKVGQIVDLGRAPGDPVELSVNGKLVARGDLVEVEGSLGVRITALL